MHIGSKGRSLGFVKQISLTAWTEQRASTHKAHIHANNFILPKVEGETSRSVQILVVKQVIESCNGYNELGINVIFFFKFVF